MGMDAAHLAASVAKSMEVERSPNATQRATDIAQEQLTGESLTVLQTKKPTAPDHLQREKIRQEKERRRRELERRSANADAPADGDDDGGSLLDVVA